MFFDETLHRIMYRPDWPEAALRCRDYSAPAIDGSEASAVQARYSVHDVPGLNSAAEISSFKANGFVVFRSAVPADVLSNAKRFRLAVFLFHPHANDLPSHFPEL
jgi:hypothetical protein